MDESNFTFIGASLPIFTSTSLVYTKLYPINNGGLDLSIDISFSIDLGLSIDLVIVSRPRLVSRSREPLVTDHQRQILEIILVFSLNTF